MQWGLKLTLEPLSSSSVNVQIESDSGIIKTTTVSTGSLFLRVQELVNNELLKGCCAVFAATKQLTTKQGEKYTNGNR